MPHYLSINKKINALKHRALILQLIREFFQAQNYIEIDAPALIKFPGQEPYLDPMPVAIHDQHARVFQCYLHTSPEYTMKKCLAAGFEKIYFLGKCYRDHEQFGHQHNPEFTMLEWYETGLDLFGLMAQTEKLIKFIIKKLNSQRINTAKISTNRFEKQSMKQLWQKYCQVNLDDYLTAPAMRKLNIQFGYQCTAADRYEDLFYKIFLNKIEPELGQNAPTIVYNYPAAMSALARLSPADPRYAERFELYINGLELANAFAELTDAAEQRQRLIKEQRLRARLKKTVFPLDQDFIQAVDQLRPCAGIALGVDRLIQLLLDCQNIDLVLPLSMNEIQNN